MPISQQLQSIKDSIETFKNGIEAKHAQTAQDDKEVLGGIEFCMLLSGIPSFRKLPGVPEHMGFDPYYVCNSPENTQELKSYLESVFGIKDAETLASQSYDFFHCFNEYYDFACEWDGTPNFDIESLSDDGKQIYRKSRDFAVLFRDYVGQQGFFAWDIGEHIMLCRAAFACGIIDRSQYEEMIMREARQCNEMFGNFAEYAVSALCGAVYYMYVTAGQFEEDGLAEFLDINLRIVGKLFADGVWSLNAWCEKNYKQLAIPQDQVEDLLGDAYLGISGVASDRILVDGYRIGVMLRETSKDPRDSGWRFFAGDESSEYLADPGNFGVVSLNLIVNYSPDVIAHIESPVGTLLARNEETDEFEPFDPENADNYNTEDPDAPDPDAFG